MVFIPYFFGLLFGEGAGVGSKKKLPGGAWVRAIKSSCAPVFVEI